MEEGEISGFGFSPPEEFQGTGQDAHLIRECRHVWQGVHHIGGRGQVMRRPPIEVSTTKARASRVKSSTMHRMRKRRPHDRLMKRTLTQNEGSGRGHVKLPSPGTKSGPFLGPRWACLGPATTSPMRQLGNVDHAANATFHARAAHLNMGRGPSFTKSGDLSDSVN